MTEFSDPFKQGRFYYLPVFHQSLDQWQDWDQASGGLRDTPLTSAALNATIHKAKQGQYRAMVLPVNSILHPEFELLVQTIKSESLDVIYQITASWLHRIWARKQSFFEAQKINFEIILDDIPQNVDLLRHLANEFSTHFTLPGVRSAPVWQKLKKIPPFCYENLHCYFPYHGDKKKLFRPSQVMDLFEQIQRLNPKAQLRSPLGIDIFEPRIQKHQELEPLGQPVFRRVCPQDPLISVVIPAFNNGRYLMNVLRHLEVQDFDKSRFEVIVVDDGSEDETSELVLQASGTLNLALTVLYYPRLRRREMGDSQFRAGLGRNLGVKWASGELLVFLDSDIIVPRHFLSKTWELHQQHDVVQWRRDYLSKSVDSFEAEYERIEPQRDCFIPEDGYWHAFYSEAQDKTWPQVKDHWKYVCTYALSMSRQKFKDLGWFRKTYCFYGFEDTDLGLRLYHHQARFFFQNEAVYHLFHETGRSEYQNSNVLRQKLLKNTARIFFHNNLSPDIYRIFKYLLKDYF